MVPTQNPKPDASETFALQPYWILKNDGDKTILYLLSNYDSSYFTLSPIAGIVLSLFDGSRTIGALAELVQFLFSCPADTANTYVLGLMQSLRDGERYPVVAKHPVFSLERSRTQVRRDLNPLQLVVPAGASPPSRGRRLNAPISLLIFFTNLCQTNCRYCYAERNRIPTSDCLTLQEWQAILQQARELQIKKVSLSGGDTFARPEGIDFVELLLEYNFLFLLSTKCYISEDYARRLAAAGFCNPVHSVPREFQFSLDSGDPDIAGFLTRRADFFSRATASIQHLIEVGIYPRVKAVLTPYNIHRLELFVEQMTGLGVNKLNFTFYEPSFYRHSDDLSLSDDQKARVSERLSTFPRKFPEVEFDGNALFANQQPESVAAKNARWQTRAGCSGGRVELGITADGKAVLCEQTPQAPPFIFGNLRNSSILDIWHSSALLDFIFPRRDKFLGTACFDCKQFNYCHYELGNCFRDAFFATGTAFDAPPSCPYRLSVPRIGNWQRVKLAVTF
jgi:radical SAM protein with 4Fe4S-binding SPASM domain